MQTGDPQSVTGNFAFTSGNGLVDENANELWSVLVCKPWLYGELGTTAYNQPGQPPTVVNTYGRQLLWSQAIAANETPSAALIQAKQATYTGIATSIQQNDPAVYPLFQGNQWTTRLEIAFGAMFAALVAGLLILLIALTLIVLKLGFLLLLVAGPFFLIIGTHPGFGRVIAIRWFEMLVGVLMKQAAIAIVLSVLLYCYSLIMGTADAVLPWALKILMIALVTVAVFIYRKPFSHLFSAVGYGTIGSQERAEYSLREAGATFRRSTLDAATVAVPGMSGYRAARWARRNPGPATAVGGRGGGRRGRGHRGVGRCRGRCRRGPGRDRRCLCVTAPAGRAASGRRTGRRGELGLPPGRQRGRRCGLGPGQERGRGRQRRRRVAPPLDLPPRSGGGAPNGSGARPAGRVGLRLVSRRRALAGHRAPAGRRALAGPGTRGHRASAGCRAPAGQRVPGGGLRPRRSGARPRGRAPHRPSTAALRGGSSGSSGVWPGLAGQRMARRGRQAALRRQAEAGPGAGPAPPAEPAGPGRQAVQRPRPGRAAGHAVLAAPDTAGQVAGGLRGSQPRPAEGRLRPGRRGAGRARLLAHPAQGDPLARAGRATASASAPASAPVRPGASQGPPRVPTSADR